MMKLIQNSNFRVQVMLVLRKIKTRHTLKKALVVITGQGTKTDEFSEKFQREGGGFRNAFFKIFIFLNTFFENKNIS